MDIVARSRIAKRIALLAAPDPMDAVGAVVVLVDDADHSAALAFVGGLAATLGYGAVRASYVKDEIEPTAYMAPWRRRVAGAGPFPLTVLFDADRHDGPGLRRSIDPSLRRVVTQALSGGDGIPPTALVIVAHKGSHADALEHEALMGVLDAGRLGVETVHA